MEQCQGEIIFLALVALPTAAAIVAWILRHTVSIHSTNDHAPVNYWGTYQDATPTAHMKGVALPSTPFEDFESASHIHTITVHP